MKKSKFTQEQIAYSLKQAELGTKVDDVYRKMASGRLCYVNGDSGMAASRLSQLRRLRQLEGEGAKLRRLVAYLSLDKAMLQDVQLKNFEALIQARTCRRTDAAIRCQPVQ